MSINTTPKRNRQDEIIIWSSFLFLMLVWGSSFILIKRSLQVFTPSEVASLRMTSAMLVLLIPGMMHLKHIPKEKMRYLVLSGLLAMLIPAFLFSFAQTPKVGINSSVAGILNALTPCMAFLVGIALFQQKTSWVRALGLFVGFAGSATLILVNSKGEIALNNYAFFIIAATFCYGLNVNLVKKYLSDIKPWHLSTVSVSICGVLGFAYLMTTNWLTAVQTHPEGKNALVSMLILGMLGTAAAQVVFNRMLQLTSAVFASSITYFIPIVAVLWGVWDGETLAVLHYFGMALIIVGVLILNKVR